MGSQARNVPMEVIGLGLCRTGTQSLADSLEALGYGTTYHMREVIKRNEVGWWAEKIEAFGKKETDKLPTKDDLDMMMSDFRGVCDLPPSLFTVQLLDAYPDAKLVLTTRPVEAWMKSMSRSILALMKTEMAQKMGTSRIGESMEYLWDHDFEANGAAFFHDFNRRVKEECAKRGREVLEIDVSHEDSWQRLCDWLGKTPPEGMTTFPHSDFMNTVKERFHSDNPETKAAAEKELWERSKVMFKERFNDESDGWNKHAPASA